MRNTSITITVPHLFSPISAFNAESKSYINTLRFNVHKTFQINPLNFLNFKNHQLFSTYLTEKTLIFHRMY